MGRAQPLRPAELAEAVVLADLSLALTVVGQVMPFGGALLVAAVVPLAIVAARHRLRAVVAGAIAAAAVGFLVIGTAALTTMAGCAAFGALVGAADRRGWTRRRTMLTGVAVLWPPIAIGADLLLWLFSSLRKLVLDQIRNGWKGLFHLLHNFGVARAADSGDRIITWIVDHWWLTVPIAALSLVVFGIWLAQGLATPALRRVSAAFVRVDNDRGARDDDRGAEPRPVPVELRDISYRYPGAHSNALSDVSARVDPGELVVVTGPNGSGKSTLARIVAGRRAATVGALVRPGAIGLGRPHGSAFVFQRPEAQVLGVRVRDDVVWGLRDTTNVDVMAALSRVGLADLADRETSTLSGGELQRLAIAAAIAREPQLFVSDESTAMVDNDGRAALVTLLRELADNGVAVVHVSHYPGEAGVADRTIALDNGRVSTQPSTNGRPVVARVARPLGATVVELHGVGHVYSRGTPWAHRALEGIDLAVRAAESVLVVGHNGSGKSTLAWIVAGLIAPSEGDVRVEGPVGLSFQHARLQLLRPTVLDEVHVGAGVHRAAARYALAEVGLDDSFANRRIDELSGGQMRRVVLAEVLARRPRVLVLDEPFAGLDADGRADLEMLLLRMRDEHGIALLIVSHDRDLPPTLVERIVELSRGRIVRDDPVEREVPT